MSVVGIRPSFCVWPTATHAWPATQDTALSRFSAALRWLGVSRTRHAVPFQTSASVRKKNRLLNWNCPTAAHELADVHHTPSRELPWETEGLGVGCTVHEDPCHASA